MGLYETNELFLVLLLSYSVQELGAAGEATPFLRAFEPGAKGSEQL